MNAARSKGVIEMAKKGFPMLSIVCLVAAFLYLVYASIGLFQDHYIGEHFKKAMDLQFRLQLFSVILPFGVQIFQYKALRSTKVYLAWMIFSIMLLGLYFAFIKDRSLIVSEGLSGMTGFKNLFFFLLWFQLCRLLSKRLYGAELVMPSEDMSQTKVDGRPYNTGDKRYLTLLDYIALVGAWIVIIVSTFN
jgi:hypothetical protein